MKLDQTGNSFTTQEVVGIRKKILTVDELLVNNLELYKKFENYIVEFDLSAVALKNLFIGLIYASHCIDDDNISEAVTLTVLLDKVRTEAKRKDPNIFNATAFDTFHFPNIGKLGK